MSPIQEYGVFAARATKRCSRLIRQSDATGSERFRVDRSPPAECLLRITVWRPIQLEAEPGCVQRRGGEPEAASFHGFSGVELCCSRPLRLGNPTWNCALPDVGPTTRWAKRSADAREIRAWVRWGSFPQRMLSAGPGGRGVGDARERSAGDGTLKPNLDGLRRDRSLSRNGLVTASAAVKAGCWVRRRRYNSVPVCRFM